MSRSQAAKLRLLLGTTSALLVVLCAVAGQANDDNSTDGGTPALPPLLTSQYGATFIDLLLDDASLISLLKLSTAESSSAIHHPPPRPSRPPKRKIPNQLQLCSLLTNLLNANQIKFCRKHQDVLEIILPQVMQLTRTECQRIAAGLRWNCSSPLGHLLDRTSSLAFTREAALVRSLLNAAMMYLVVKTCSEDQRHLSCGCLTNNNNNHGSDIAENTIDSRAKRKASEAAGFELAAEEYNVLASSHDLSAADLSTLDSGRPLRLASPVVRRQGCLANVGFAAAFTRVFMDADDTKILNKAFRVLNGEQAPPSKGASLRHGFDADNRDLAIIRWSKSAVLLHNNHVGRQMVLEALQRKCRCHGVSGVCPFETCWDHLLDFETIAKRLGSLYLAAAEGDRVEVRNSGSPEKPDLYLGSRGRAGSLKAQGSGRGEPAGQPQHEPLSSNLPPALMGDPGLSDLFQLPADSAIDRQLRGDELVYLYDSPDYCEPIARIGHPGTKGRTCEPLELMRLAGVAAKTSGRDQRVENPRKMLHMDQEEEATFTPLGSCEHLCCNRGHRSELVLDMVTCNCRFKFCCKVECDHCLRQRVQHHCL